MCDHQSSKGSFHCKKKILKRVIIDFFSFAKLVQSTLIHLSIPSTGTADLIEWNRHRIYIKF